LQTHRSACRSSVQNRIKQKISRFKSTAAAQHNELQRKEADAAAASARKKAEEEAAAAAAAAKKAAAAAQAAETAAQEQAALKRQQVLSTSHLLHASHLPGMLRRILKLLYSFTLSHSSHVNVVMLRRNINTL
jgi:glucan-binding YG repeat protein